MSVWEVLLLIAAVLVAVRSLSNLMRARRDRLVSEVQKQVEEHQEQMKAKRRKAREQGAA